MYQHFNPWENPGAWWQHLLMLVVAGILGYIIGYLSRKSQVENLETQLAALETDVDDCQRSKKTVVARDVAPAVVPVAVPTTPDDLKIVEGIGPKIEQLLNQAGILTFAQLANTAPERITEILRAAGPRFQIHDPATWPQQAAMARDGQWETLKAWQDALNKGKES